MNIRKALIHLWVLFPKKSLTPTQQWELITWKVATTKNIPLIASRLFAIRDSLNSEEAFEHHLMERDFGIALFRLHAFHHLTLDDVKETKFIFEQLRIYISSKELNQ